MKIKQALFASFVRWMKYEKESDNTTNNDE